MKQLVTILLVLLILPVFAGCKAPEHTKEATRPAGANEEAEIYAVAIRDIQAFARSSGAPGRRLVYLLNSTDDLVYDGAPVASSQKFSAELQEAITAELAGDPFELIWIEAMDNAPVDPAGGQISDGNGIIITLGNIHPQDDGSIFLSYFMTCGDLCGLGKTYIFNNYYNNWHITGSVGPTIAS